MNRVFAWFFALVAACSFDGTTTDVFDASGPDAGVIGLDASVSSTWSAPLRLLALSSATDDRYPTVASSGLSVTFTRTEMIGAFFVNVPFRSVRSNVESDFAPAVRLAPFATVSVSDIEMRDDELEWFMWKGLGQLAVSTRLSTAAPWGAPLDLGVDGFSPSLSADGLALYTVTSSGGLARLDRSSIVAPWSGPIAVGFASSFEIASVDIGADELSLLITARTGNAAAGVYIASRPDQSSSFGDPVRIPALEGPYRNARFSLDDTEILVTAELGGSEEIFRSVLQ